ncbi:adenine phosphoribosyltransferase [Dokdonia pacifica]|uniref:Adenine phosphoribosyltransferase n=1 Tax=Dokdonia pacifica TaxID=1627892 RepID=A0A238YZL8_9FLAO|nr:adenine phosphoribosyltransferase [Dokdonia pacifica]GGG09069.1 adenine phosphoribosyltransferase [Dokdonia pacifica]SNR76595.1 adenine phosphoribosyltransferase [Dokdonia pacifica]
MKLNNYIRDIQDFPTEGIIFKDITPLLGDASAFAKASQELLALVGDQHIDKVVGVESRGFFFGGVLAKELNAGFVPVRKPGKLPYTTASQSYALEYGTDTLEIHEDAIQPGDKVLLHDDVLATGGTAAAVVKLIERLGGEVVQCNFLIELSFLSGKDKLEGKMIKAAITY